MPVGAKDNENTLVVTGKEFLNNEKIDKTLLPLKRAERNTNPF